MIVKVVDCDDDFEFPEYTTSTGNIPEVKISVTSVDQEKLAYPDLRDSIFGRMLFLNPEKVVNEKDFRNIMYRLFKTGCFRIGCTESSIQAYAPELLDRFNGDYK